MRGDTTKGLFIVVGYCRNFIPGGTFFFTIALADRRSTFLTTSIA